MGGYQQLVRGDVMRGKFRKSFEKPEAFEPGEPTAVKFAFRTFTTPSAAAIASWSRFNRVGSRWWSEIPRLSWIFPEPRDPIIAKPCSASTTVPLWPPK